eukprot:518705-Pelagomonas_calceolata.AAC.6
MVAIAQMHPLPLLPMLLVRAAIPGNDPGQACLCQDLPYLLVCAYVAELSKNLYTGSDSNKGAPFTTCLTAFRELG